MSSNIPVLLPYQITIPFLTILFVHASWSFTWFLLFSLSYCLSQPTSQVAPHTFQALYSFLLNVGFQVHAPPNIMAFPVFLDFTRALFPC
ncbi:hypothetical protein CROQUDRAFT_585000 [Cronartium quercuum f. sp. fusiforme G11]|uniref:Uncharacterized protein n=1 Tax=Cronartium quercuum f. sp. fusiforme G11 TaxID=708437 RepID=A0A9P6NGI6_9BASI|nr:hypothetical protein CROQUDRAFT_585000 [Cronartium quercuum f. sp. fusiforme G11]